MTIFAFVIGDTPVRVWGLTARERLRRQFRQVKGVAPIDDLGDLPEESAALIVRADYVTEARTLNLLTAEPGVVLRCPADGQLAAAFVSARQVEAAIALLKRGDSGDSDGDGSGGDSDGGGGGGDSDGDDGGGDSDGDDGGGDSDGDGSGDAAVAPPRVPADFKVVTPATLGGYDLMLRRAEPPLLEPSSEDNRQALEDKLYGSSYKGITDLVTKWLWPRPAKKGVRFCVAAGLTPNMVTAIGIALMLAACGLFYEGYFIGGLAAGWFMTYLDTVDGKLARVTVQSSKSGHALDHGMDIIHPPFWYVLWGMALVEASMPFGLDRADMYWLIALGYVFGRVAEQSFHLLGDTAMFTWQPFDAWFRLITARRNPCLIILTAACLAGRPDWGFIGVTLWTVATTAVLILRLLQGIVARVRHGPLHSWLADREAAARRYPKSYQIFTSTRSAYAPG